MSMIFCSRFRLNLPSWRWGVEGSTGYSFNWWFCSRSSQQCRISWCGKGLVQVWDLWAFRRGPFRTGGWPIYDITWGSSNYTPHMAISLLCNPSHYPLVIQHSHRTNGWSSANGWFSMFMLNQRDKFHFVRSCWRQKRTAKNTEPEQPLDSSGWSHASPAEFKSPQLGWPNPRRFWPGRSRIISILEMHQKITS